MKRLNLRGFTLVEVLVSITILSMILLVVTSVIGQAQRSWKLAAARVGQFRESRAAFDTVVKNLRQAVLNTRYDYDYTGVDVNNPFAQPGGPLRMSDLYFRCGDASTLFPGIGGAAELAGNAVLFQAPLGYTLTLDYKPLKSTLVERGYAVRYSDDRDAMPQGLVSALQPKGRYRLFEYRPATEFNQFYQGVTEGNISGAGAGSLVPVADNIIAVNFSLAFVMGSTASAAFGQPPDVMQNSYNSTVGGGVAPDKLPVGIRVTMVAIDEASAGRLALQSGGAAPNLLARSGVNFSNANNLSRDLLRLGDYLTSVNMNYRVFSEFIQIPAGDTY
jgi:uncharacterized protein (TIGR02599 family)